MTAPLAWYVARASGLVALALLTASVLWGLALSTGLLGRSPSRAWLLDLHRFLGALSLVFIGVHVGSLVADNTVQFGWAETLVPMASAWKPGTVALGVVGLYLAVAVELTSLMMSRIPRRWWKVVHSSSFGLFWAAMLHGILAGTDSPRRLVWLGYVGLSAVMIFAIVTRIWIDRRPVRARRASVPLAVHSARQVERQETRHGPGHQRAGGLEGEPGV
jgi:predicted ferric reductase